MSAMNLASIDIGSNGARLLIKRFDPEAIREEDRIKKLMFFRIPLRLGKDVFTLGKVSKEREKMMLHMMKGFKQFMKLNDVEAFRACATSAMRIVPGSETSPLSASNSPRTAANRLDLPAPLRPTTPTR